MATNSSILAWRILQKEKPGRPQSTGSQRVGYSWSDSACIATAAAKSLQLCSTLCGPIDGSPPGSPVPGILQARILEWVAISFSNAWKWKVKVKLLSIVRLLSTPWTAAYQAPPSMGFSRQEYWSGVPLPSPLWPHGLQHIRLPCGIADPAHSASCLAVHTVCTVRAARISQVRAKRLEEEGAVGTGNTFTLSWLTQHP